MVRVAGVERLALQVQENQREWWHRTARSKRGAYGSGAELAER